GTTTIQASQAGNANYNAAADVQQALNVGKAQQAITFASLADKTFGDAAFDLTASGGASGNAVSYASSNNNVATINGNKVTIMGAGSIKITASQAGNGNYHAASDVEQTLNIGKASQAITFTALADKTFGDTDFNLTASGGSSGNTITYSSSNTNVATISGNKVTIVGAGTTTITASQAGSANYSAAADVQQTLNVGKASQNITFSTLADKTFGDANFTLNVTGGGSANQVGFISSDPQVATVSGNQITIVGAGTVSITATQAGDGNYDAATPVTRTFSVAKATATITLGNLVQVYDGSPKSVAMVTNPAGLSGLMVSYNGSPDLPVVAGNYQVVATLINGNYMASPATAVLVIEKATATLTLGNLSQVYDGTPKTVGITTSPAHLSSVAITYNGSSSLPIGAGTYAVVAQLNDPNYTANLVSANLVIGKAAAILHIGNLVQTYDGAPKSVLVTTNPVGLSGTSITYNGSSVAPTAAGTYNVVVTLTNADYSASILASTLTVNPQPVTVTATAKHITYGDADPLLTYISAPVLAVGDRFTGALSRTAGSQAGTYPIILNDLTAGPNYMINYVAANLTIDKKPLLITADNKTRNFNVANPVLTASFNGFIPGETNAVLLNQPVLTTTATQNSATGTYPIQVGVANADNYIISYAPGTLTIVPTAQSIAFSALPDRLSTDGTFNLTASSSAGLAISYQSSDPSVARIINVNQVEILKAGIVTITASQAGDANFTAATSVSQQLRIIDNPPPILAIISSLGNSISKGEITKLTVSGANSYVWSNADGIISGQTTATLTVRPFTTTTYTVTGKNQYGRSSSKNITIEVRPDLQAVSVAPSATNIISPNGDGVNDFFVVNNIDAYPNNSVVIFDRTGKTLYKVKSYKNDWDGRVNGLLLEEGTYYYIIEFGDGKTNAIKGFITIVKE
ncbi:MAG: MBG domain-containing protein, partial [Pedobacter sp.]|nr:MBG domain-containing protein [Pedobacter sp.]